VALAVALSVLALVQSLHRAKQGRCALLKWRPDVEALTNGAEVYGRDAETLEEGFPLLPVAGLGMVPFLALGDVGGALAFAALKVALAWWMLASALRLASDGRGLPTWASLLVVLLSVRVLLSDISHGNVNIVVGATVVAAAVSWSRGHDVRAGLFAGLGAVLKVTPALLLAYFVWKRGWRAAAGFALGVILFAFCLPALFLGWSLNLALTSAWWQQMVQPFLSGAAPTLVQTEQINQSFFGVFARLLTDAVAIDGEPPTYVNVLSLSPGALRFALLGASAATAVALAFCLRRGARRDGPVVLGEFSMLALAMLFLSERSWKHHWVLTLLPLAFLTGVWVRRGTGDKLGRAACAAVVAAALLFGLTGSGVLGDRGSDLAEAYGAFLLGGLILFTASGAVLRRASGGSGATP
jgi:hypothetical protein